jgi:hypothetical protein
MRYMRPITVSTDVPQSREDVFDYLDVLANHEQFTDHMMRNWRLQGPQRGVGARARVDVVLAGRSEAVDIEVFEVEAPVRTVERNTGAAGRRVATGTYKLDQLSDGRTRVTFQYAWDQIPFTERLAAPIVRRITRSALKTAMQRLSDGLHNGAVEREPDRAP